MKRFALLALTTLGLLTLGGPGVSTASGDNYGVRTCSHGLATCTEVAESISSGGNYIGHDEPSLLFYSNTAGAGNSNQYLMKLPTDPKVLPNQSGTAGTWNFQLRPAFWFGMAMCDTQSAPEFTHSPCTPDSDTNIKDGADPAAADYIGRHAGTAFMEMQFYPPGWVSWPPGNSCDPVQWCAALNIDSLNRDQNTNPVTNNNPDCLNRVGLEPVSFAFITTSGVPHAAPDPLSVFSPPFDALTPNPATDLFMNSGDVLSVDLHDTAAGFQVVIHDLTTGQSGSMTASVANGFAQVNYQPTATTCSESPYAYHPMYATSSEHTRVPWAAHSYNVAFSDEIGHFEYCNLADEATGNCLDTNEPGGLDADDTGCFNADDSLFVLIAGCNLFPTGGDIDFDGVPYQPVWPGTNPNRGQDKKYHPSSVLFTSPTSNGQNFERVAFETDLPRIEAPDSGGICDRATGANCVNPPPGANFYPIYSTGTSNGTPSGRCVWQLGGTGIKGTTNTFGGNSTAEYGPLLQSVYPGPGFVPLFRYNNFHQTLASNPCPG
jgi:hypothetical protein